MSLDRYLYADANPETLVDPSGHSTRALIDYGSSTAAADPGIDWAKVSDERKAASDARRRISRLVAHNGYVLPGKSIQAMALSQGCGSRCLAIYAQNFVGGIGDNISGLAQTGACIYDPSCLVGSVATSAVAGAQAYVDPITTDQAVVSGAGQFVGDLTSSDPARAGRAGGTLTFQAGLFAVGGALGDAGVVGQEIAPEGGAETGNFLFRGVSEDHPAFSNALRGIVKPRGGQASALEHNLGDTLSPFTSWTTDPAIARDFAVKSQDVV